MMHHVKKQHIEPLFLYGIAVAAIIILSSISSDTTKNSNLSAAQTQTHKNEKLSFVPNSFDAISIIGKAYVIYDIKDQKIIASKNESQVMPLASLTKIMMAYTALKHHEKATKIIVHPESLDGTYDLGLSKNQVWTLSELLKYTLVFSSNDGAQIIADSLEGREKFINQMNQDAIDLGLTLQFTHPAGLDEGAKIGGLGSALSVAKLLAISRAGYPDIFDATTKTRSSVVVSTGKLTGIPNTNQSINQFSGALASKTGYTTMAGGNLAIIVDYTVGHPVAIVVLGSTHEDRFLDVKALYDAMTRNISKE